jgi:hypothetical protein
MIGPGCRGRAHSANSAIETHLVEGILDLRHADAVLVPGGQCALKGGGLGCQLQDDDLVSAIPEGEPVEPADLIGSQVLPNLGKGEATGLPVGGESRDCGFGIYTVLYFR